MKKLFSILLAACLLLSVCAGALAEDKKVIDHAAYSQFPLVKDGEKLTITVAHIRDAAYGVDVEKMWFWNWAEAVTGVDFEVQQILSNSKGDLLPLMFAGGDVPDLLYACKKANPDHTPIAAHATKDPSSGRPPLL